ncbi:MAG TPA: GNAT family N-acetyltransferase [Burkholderiaceae bacterium]|nr:GNAT family N-acetyltransferase [Burkholderiaceae bacterium]
MQSNDYVIRLHEDPLSLDASAWNRLLDAQDAPTPFMRHAYLAALHASGSAAPDTGWAPQWLTVERGGELHGAAALYLKSHSYGEYVFDWAWADAYQRHGLPYYPKLLGAVPFTPVPGSRLLARDDAARDALLLGLRSFAQRAGLSSAHLLFLSDADRAACERAGWMLRENVQFHWIQREGRPYADFDDLRSSLQREKRKKIAQERRRVAESQVHFEVHEGGAIDEPLWDFFYRCYTLTYRAHHSTPYLTRAFFREMARAMPAHWLMFVALRGERRIAASLIALDPERQVAYGRYWGAIEHVPCLHFEACYYQPLAWCIANGYQRFEGGAQGEHKMARGLLPVRTWSAHWLADARFASAVEDFLAREGAGVEAYLDELNERNPFRTQALP